MALKKKADTQSGPQQLTRRKVSLINPARDLFPKDVMKQFGGDEELLSSLESLSEKLHESGRTDKSKPVAPRKIQPKASRRIN